MKILKRRRGWRGGAVALALCAFVAGSGVAQTPQSQAKAPAAKAAGVGKTAKKAAASDFKMVVEPRAMDLLKAAGAKLAAAKTMAFTATAGYEYPSKLGPPIVYTIRYDVTMQRPDKLRIITPGDGPASEFYYDGKAMIAYVPAENLAAVADAPPTIDEALDRAYKNAAIFFPFEDLLAADPYAAMTNGAILAFYIGPSAVIGGTKTDMVAWANNDVFLQIWIGAEDKLPRRIRAMYRADPLALRHQVDLSNWQLDQPLSPDTFASDKAKSAGHMAFAAPTPPPKGVKPLTAGKAKSSASAKAPTKSN